MLSDYRGSVMAEVNHSMVDVHGNIVEVLMDNYGEVYVPLSQLEAAGFQLFDSRTFNIRTVSDE